MSAVLFAGSMLAPSFCAKSFVLSAKVIGLGAGGFGFGVAVCAGSVCCACARPAINSIIKGTATISFLISILPFGSDAGKDDAATRRRGDKAREDGYGLISLSPHLPISPSSHRRVFSRRVLASPCL